MTPLQKEIAQRVRDNINGFVQRRHFSSSEWTSVIKGTNKGYFRIKRMYVGKRPQPFVYLTELGTQLIN